MTTLTKLRKEAKAYGKNEIFYDVFCDRVNFSGFDRWMVDFWTRRGVVADYDRSGVSIDIKDAIAHGLPVNSSTVIAPCSDLRKKVQFS